MFQLQYYKMDSNILAICIAQNYFECTNYLFNLYDDSDIINVILTSKNEKEKHICNVENYVEQIIPSLSSEYFKSHFR